MGPPRNNVRSGQFKIALTAANLHHLFWISENHHILRHGYEKSQFRVVGTNKIKLAFDHHLFLGSRNRSDLNRVALGK